MTSQHSSAHPVGTSDFGMLLPSFPRLLGATAKSCPKMSLGHTEELILFPLRLTQETGGQSGKG